MLTDSGGFVRRLEHITSPRLTSPHLTPVIQAVFPYRTRRVSLGHLMVWLHCRTHFQCTSTHIYIVYICVCACVCIHDNFLQLLSPNGVRRSHIVDRCVPYFPPIACLGSLQADGVNGDISLAFEWLRKRGIAKATAMADRSANEGRQVRRWLQTIRVM